MEGREGFDAGRLKVAAGLCPMFRPGEGGAVDRNVGPGRLAPEGRLQ